MLDYSIQNFTFTRNRIYPNDWLQTKPYLHADEVDLYYVKLANKVADIIRESLIAEAFDTQQSLLKAALVITCWFEDLCSNIGIWRVVNDECTKRYGSKLPFYNIEDYIPGIVNQQDLCLLIWDLVQSEHKDEGRVMNPENPGKWELANTLFELLNEEYETAPENERLYEFVHNHLATTQIWEARGLMSWFHYRSYIGHHNFQALMDTIYDEIEEEDWKKVSPKILYGYSTVMTFTHKRNLLSLTTPQWLARIRMDKVYEDLTFDHMSMYLFKEFDEDGMVVEDLVNGEKCTIDYESFDPKTFRKSDFKERETIISLAKIKFGNKYYLCGSMVSNSMDNKMRERIDEEEKCQRILSSFPQLRDDFVKASGGKEFLLMENAEDMEQFITKKMKFKFSEGVQLPANLRNEHNFIFGVSKKDGIVSAPKLAKCIAMKGNKLYDKQFARENAIVFFANPQAIHYELACYMQDNDLVPDAYINSMNGEDYGREFLHKHGRFFTDYHFACCREYDL